MRETQPVVFRAPEFEGEELDDYPPDTLDLLLGQSDHFLEDEQEREVVRGQKEADLQRDRTKSTTGSAIELHPSEEALLTPRDELDVPQPSRGLILTPAQEPGLPAQPPAPAQRKRRRSMKREDVSSREVKTARTRKQLIFFDPETQLSEEVMRQQINNPLIETRKSVFPSSVKTSPALLFSSPCCSFLPEEIQFLWQQAATITPLSDSDLRVGERGPESTDSEREREREMMEKERGVAEEAENELERITPGPEKALRQAAETSDISDQGTLFLEGSHQQEGSQEISPVHSLEREGLGVLMELPREEGRPQLFLSFLPPDVDRRSISSCFHRLLGALSRREVRAEQGEPYGDIWLSPGSGYTEVPLF